MALKFPNGSQFGISTAIGSVIEASAISNSNPAEVTTAREPAAQPFANLQAPKPKDEEEALDVESVFAKLKQLKTSE